MEMTYREFREYVIQNGNTIAILSEDYREIEDEDDEEDGYFIPKGTKIMFGIDRYNNLSSCSFVVEQLESEYTLEHDSNWSSEYYGRFIVDVNIYLRQIFLNYDT